MLPMRKAKSSAVTSASAPSWNCVYCAKRIGCMISVECNRPISLEATNRILVRSSARARIEGGRVRPSAVGRLEVDDQLESCLLLHRHFGRIGSLQKSAWYRPDFGGRQLKTVLRAYGKIRSLALDILRSALPPPANWTRRRRSHYAR